MWFSMLFRSSPKTFVLSTKPTKILSWLCLVRLDSFHVKSLELTLILTMRVTINAKFYRLSLQKKIKTISDVCSRIVK